MTNKVSAANIDVLGDSAFEIPKSRPAGDFGAFLKVQNQRFFDATERFSGEIADRLKEGERVHWMRELASTLEAVVDVTRQGRHDRAWQLMEDILDEHWGVLKLMSLRHASKVVGSRSWYRLTTWPEAKRRQDIFHLPFDKKAGSYRFSPPGRPAIYLGNNVYLCWLECLAPPLESCRVARFEVSIREKEFFLDLPTNHASYLEPVAWDRSIADAFADRSIKDVWTDDPRQVMNSPYFDDVERELVEYLSLWPLLMAVTVQKREPKSDDPPEYLLPQLLMRWVLKQKNLLGIRYFTSKFDRTTNSNDVSINVVLPTRTTDKDAGFCDFLVERVRCTPPQSFKKVKRVANKKLFTDHSTGERLKHAGRYMIELEGRPQHYHRTPFGRMEYWLDSPELAVARIDSD